MDKPRTVQILRGSTGTRGEQDFTAHMATHQMNVMNTTGVLEERAIDCTFSKADYIDFKPHLVIATMSTATARTARCSRKHHI